jgi:hypothetical protein
MSVSVRAKRAWSPGSKQRHSQAREPIFSVPAFVDYCSLRQRVEAGMFRDVRVADVDRFRELRTRFAARSFDDLYKRWEQDGEVVVRAAEAHAPKVQPCALRAHELGFRYDP